ncbi:unnamed protein product [Symbiodinium sp. KB8]|nr:unnamed protein product [Symbiodinium sp. KB8]
MSAAAYQRALVLTCSWHCEQRLQSFLMTKGSPTERSRSEVKSLLAVLRGIHSELVPTERVLWELMGQQQQHFDGTVGKEEVLSALEELLGFHEEDARASPGELEELGRLRRQCQRRSVDNLFDDRGRTVVAFADVLRWWWDMPEEYREAAGLAVPASVLRQSLRRQPEEMFRGALRRVAAEPAVARQALRGHVRAFAELRALAVRRNIESFSIRSTAESRTTTSDAGDISLATSEDQADLQEAGQQADVWCGADASYGFGFRLYPLKPSLRGRRAFGHACLSGPARGPIAGRFGSCGEMSGFSKVEAIWLFLKPVGCLPYRFS